MYHDLCVGCMADICLYCKFQECDHKRTFKVEILEVIYVKDRNIYFAFARDENYILNIVLLNKEQAEKLKVDKEVLWNDLSSATRENLERILEGADG